MRSEERRIRNTWTTSDMASKTNIGCIIPYLKNEEEKEKKRWNMKIRKERKEKNENKKKERRGGKYFMENVLLT